MGVKIVGNIFEYILLRKGKTIGIKKIDDLFFFLSGLKLGAEGKDAKDMDGFLTPGTSQLAK